LVSDLVLALILLFESRMRSTADLAPAAMQVFHLEKPVNIPGAFSTASSLLVLLIAQDAAHLLEALQVHQYTGITSSSHCLLK
jgi:hypothetical protein